MNIRRPLYSAVVLTSMLPLIIVYHTGQLVHWCARFIDRARGARWSEALVRGSHVVERWLVRTFGEWREHPGEQL